MVIKKKIIVNSITLTCSLYYLWMLIKIIIIKDGFNDYGFRYNLELFDFINHYINYGFSTYLIINVLGNICLFIPFSIIAKHYFSFLNNLHIFILGLMISSSFELIQLGSGWGIFDVDDILLNALGCLIGIIIYRIISLFNNNAYSINIFLICFGCIGMLSVYRYNPSLLLI